jgi:hypothetical protein
MIGNLTIATRRNRKVHGRLAAKTGQLQDQSICLEADIPTAM